MCGRGLLGRLPGLASTEYTEDANVEGLVLRGVGLGFKGLGVRVLGFGCKGCHLVLSCGSRVGFRVKPCSPTNLEPISWNEPCQTSYRCEKS